MEIKTSHLAGFVLFIILLSAIFTQRFLLTYNHYAIFDRMADGVISSEKAVKESLLKAIGRGQQSDHHPQVSPRVGTDIHPDNHDNILKCHNQSHCIVPDLQLQRRFKVYFCTKGVHQGIRFFYLAREGLLLHPNVQLVEFQNIHEAEIIVYLPASSPWDKTECSDPALASRLLVIEEFDGDNMYSPYGNVTKMEQVYGPTKRWYSMYFKRSFVHRRDGRFLHFRGLDHPDVYPMVYSLANSYSQLKFNHDRPIDITCTLRGNKQMSTRLRVQQWTAAYIKAHNITNSVQGELNHDTRTKISTAYFTKLFNSKIIVTVNPANWEGDFRLWESLATGALVMVDHLFVPYPYPLVDGKHIVYFDNQNETDFMHKLDYYHHHPRAARKIAVAGYLYAMKYHRTVSMMDYFLRSVHVKIAEDEADEGSTEPIPQYKYTAQYLLNETRKQMELIKAHHKPGKFIH